MSATPFRRLLMRTAALFLPALLLAVSCQTPETRAATRVDAPPTAGDTSVSAWLHERATQERGMAARSRVYHDFRFTDKRAASGITFTNQIVDDAGRTYKPVHYDHGTGVCAADVDGDGLPDLYFVTQLGKNELWRNTGAGRFM